MGLSHEPIQISVQAGVVELRACLGEMGRGSAPEPRQLVLPPADYPKDMRGRQVEVTFYVTADGRVDRIDVAPEIRDGGFARRFAEAMRNYRFRPARSAGGAPVPGTTTVTVFF